jgi:DNA-binding MarR family transcriptional regulator
MTATMTTEDQGMMINKEMSPQRAAVLAVLHRAGRPMRLFEIADATRMKPSNVAALLYDMRRDGQADYTGPRFMRRWTPNHSGHSAPQRTCYRTAPQ